MTGRLKSPCQIVLPLIRMENQAYCTLQEDSFDKSWSNYTASFWTSVLFNKMKSYWVIITTQTKQYGYFSPGLYLITVCIWDWVVILFKHRRMGSEQDSPLPPPRLQDFLFSPFPHFGADTHVKWQIFFSFSPKIPGWPVWVWRIEITGG